MATHRQQRYMEEFVCKASEVKDSQELFELFISYVDFAEKRSPYNEFILSVLDTYGDEEDILRELEKDRSVCEVIAEGFHSSLKDSLIEIFIGDGES